MTMTMNVGGHHTSQVVGGRNPHVNDVKDWVYGRDCTTRETTTIRHGMKVEFESPSQIETTLLFARVQPPSAVPKASVGGCWYLTHYNLAKQDFED